jgi:protein-tyrosine phosphatase
MARALRHAPDRLLHPGRRRRVVRALGEGRLPGSTLFVCYGNICRSPYAEHVFRRSLPEELRDRCTVASAGLYGKDRRSPELAIEVAGRRGVDLTEHRSTLLGPELASRVQLIVVMSREQQRQICAQYRRHPDTVLVLGDLDPDPIETRTITDPYACPEAVFEASYARIDRCIAELVRALPWPVPQDAVLFDS